MACGPSRYNKMFRKDKAKLRYYPPAGYSKPKVTASNQQTFYTVGDKLVAFKI